MEKVKIVNFGGINSLELELKPITILIGPQGSGKSVVAKLLYFFKSFAREIVKNADIDLSKREFDKSLKRRFESIFPPISWPKDNFKIEYLSDKVVIIVEKNNSGFKISYSEILSKVLSKFRRTFSEEMSNLNRESSHYSRRSDAIEKASYCFEKEIGREFAYSQYFVPAGRSFFANLQKSIFSFLSDNRSLDPLLLEFGRTYENFKQLVGLDAFKGSEAKDIEFDNIVSKIVNGRLVKEKNEDFIMHTDGRKVNLANASSGQQETLPLLVILQTFMRIRFNGNGAVLYIEEPEAHLFPTAQKRIVHLLARVFNNEKSNFQIIITTHSPYILASFNNLLEAGKLVKNKPESISEIEKIIPRVEQISSEKIIAYSIDSSGINNIIDFDSGLISQTILDDVSNEISSEFSELVNIEFP